MRAKFFEVAIQEPNSHLDKEETIKFWVDQGFTFLKERKRKNQEIVLVFNLPPDVVVRSNFGGE